jgi:DNA polymerase III subunit epsilon
VDNSHRQLHGALLDAQLLAEAYLALTSGQCEIGFASPEPGSRGRVAVSALPELPAAARPRVVASAEELALHRARIEAISKGSGRALWEEAPGGPEELRDARRAATA